jgi:hypothetical protein
MKLFAQHGSNGKNRIPDGFERGLLDGVIMSPRDIRYQTLIATLDEIADLDADAARLFDPQFYGCFHATLPGSRLGELNKGDYAYFGTRRRSALEREANVRTDIRACLEFQADLNLTAFIAPNIVIRRSLDSREAVIAKSFIRNTAEVHEEIGYDLPVFATLAISIPALLNRQELHGLLSDLTALDVPPRGFYLLIENPEGDVSPWLMEPEALANWLLINHSLKINGFEVINGYSDVLSPYLGITGADAGAGGWWNTLKTFSLSRFEPTAGGGRFPIARYTSCALLKSIRYTELHALRDEVPEILNDLPTDALYDADEGSKPEEYSNEALQNWEAIRELNDRLIVEGDIEGSLEACRDALNDAEQYYVQAAEAGVALRDRSNSQHIDAILDGLASFERQAEI